MPGNLRGGLDHNVLCFCSTGLLGSRDEWRSSCSWSCLSCVLLLPFAHSDRWKGETCFVAQTLNGTKAPK